jgi:hypothetical protein
MYILVPHFESTLDISRFFLTATHSYCAKGGWNFEAKVCWMQGSLERV